MKCSKCGTPISSDDEFCKGCGASVIDMNFDTGKDFIVDDQEPKNKTIPISNQQMNQYDQSCYEEKKRNYFMISFAVALGIILIVTVTIFLF